ncbi:DNA-(apurinic or apyrimidinic site) lyase [Novosphingobium aromaticivorans DSM 12444]|uniref:Formamidopyrimidine-DNA glycosylase n=1 Tax=Novosphingobium aromaticivorans (strain ATCC 700278 / DSM 12444 / CCUG 56034 / CIP 105152 / NBRC 16084 / F199) TaxID=279238 RepID=FPG_NOVAD|nr:bifunctional DNA-formamidopyrimidine glycosylase/DNA-(apurinic or apyrimidinic site) lyase [Novosphingobium aromaticivorans]Q2GAT0.1 RecName: Full=Formamidopyrimidine-DNA glycosylase; Short=Fapy-DNA glycosylase; AltName: Full=DNA-(apurinic or apyrimidinic site) lyase MutM; Short=AP lyase MutM [Novosphingobium aromaticivorans DSM 12444]ABD25043.1 DNA-(apurinic or apyrimidinic site) lyase [Novosphingobium aromaticivorans DSM 12444]SCY87180.1 DNA-(apurinic or apyrimidinic site) lyase [Novosphing
MPELPEVETTVRGLATVLDGQVIRRVAVNRADLRRPFPEDLAQALTGARVTGMGRRAKYGLIHTDRERTMVFHLGMSGRWRIDPEDIGKHDHLVLETGEGRVLSLNDARRFGSVDLVDTGRLEEWPPFAALGPEPLGPGLKARHLAKAFEGRIAAVKLLLLDQQIVAGLGNIYVCEALYRARIHPEREGGKVSARALGLLVPAIRAVLEESIAAGGSTLRDYARPDGELGYFAKDWRVYGREGEPCQCGGVVKRIVQGGRSTFFCPRCQK